MKRIKMFSAFFYVVFFMPIFAVLSLVSISGADDCTATVSPDYMVHIPAVHFDTGVYSLNLQYVPSNDGNVWFVIKGINIADTLKCDNHALLFPFSDAYSLYIPSLELGGVKYWVTMQYEFGTTSVNKKTVHAPTGGGFSVTNANLEDLEIEPLVPSPTVPSPTVPSPTVPSPTVPSPTEWLPDYMLFGTSITVDQGPGGFKVHYTIKSNKILLGQDIPSLVGPSTSFSTTGNLYLTVDSCSWNPPPHSEGLSATCSFDGPGVGTISVDLDISDSFSPNPNITMKYHMSMPPNQVVMRTHTCIKSDGLDFCEDDSDDKGSGFVDLFSAFHTSELQEPSGDLVPGGLRILKNIRPSCDGCGWPYATKFYPYQKIVPDLPGLEGAYYEERGTYIAIYQ